MSANKLWKALKSCSIDIDLGSADFIHMTLKQISLERIPYELRFLNIHCEQLPSNPWAELQYSVGTMNLHDVLSQTSNSNFPLYPSTNSFYPPSIASTIARAPMVWCRYYWSGTMPRLGTKHDTHHLSFAQWVIAVENATNKCCGFSRSDNWVTGHNSATDGMSQTLNGDRSDHIF